MEPDPQHPMMRRARLALAVLLVSGCVAEQSVTAPETLSQPPAPESREFISKLSYGQTALANGQLSEARDSYLSAVRISAGNPRAILGLAESHLALGQTEQAAQLLGSIKTLPDPIDRARLDQARGIAALRMNRPEEARSHLERSVDANASQWRAWIALGRLHLDANRRPDATAAFLMAEQTAPDSASAHNDIGMAYLRLENTDAAVSHFRRALQIRPGHAVAEANLRIVQAMKGDYQAAMAGVDPANRPDALNNVGYVALLKGDYDLAHRYFRQAMELSPTHHAVAAANLELIPD